MGKKKLKTKKAKARKQPWPPHDVNEILENLRPLANAVDVSASGDATKRLAKTLEEKVGPINGRINYGDGNEWPPRQRTLNSQELRLTVTLSAILAVLLNIKLNCVPADCGAKLRRLAEDLCNTFPQDQADAQASAQKAKTLPPRCKDPVRINDVICPGLSRSTVMRAIGDELKTYRKGTSGPHILSRSEVDRLKQEKGI